MLSYDATYVALSANHLIAVVLGGKSLERRLNDTTTQTKDQVKGGLLLLMSASNSFKYFNLFDSTNSRLAEYSHTFWIL